MNKLVFFLCILCAFSAHSRDNSECFKFLLAPHINIYPNATPSFVIKRPLKNFKKVKVRTSNDPFLLSELVILDPEVQRLEEFFPLYFTKVNHKGKEVEFHFYFFRENFDFFPKIQKIIKKIPSLKEPLLNLSLRELILFENYLTFYQDKNVFKFLYSHLEKDNTYFDNFLEGLQHIKDIELIKNIRFNHENIFLAEALLGAKNSLDFSSLLINQNNSTAVQTPREQEIFLSCLSLFQNRSVGGTNKYNLIPWVLAELALLSHQENATPVIFETSQENIWHPLLEKSKLKHHQSFWKKFFSFTSLGFFIQDREEGWILHIIPKINSGSSYVRISPLLQNYLLKKINQRNQQDLHSFFEKYFQKEFSFISYDQQQIQKMDPEKIAILGEFILQNNYVDFENFMQI